MNEIPIRKRISSVKHFSLKKEFFAGYYFDRKIKELFIKEPELSEYSLECLGEDWETARQPMGQLCDADAISMVIHYEQQLENKRRAKEMLDNSLNPVFQQILDSFTKPLDNEQK